MAGGRGHPCPPRQVRRRAGRAVRGWVGRPPAGRPTAAAGVAFGSAVPSAATAPGRIRGEKRT